MPVVVSGGPVTNPRIGYHRITGTLAASSAEAGFAAANANSPLTYTFWRPTSRPANWRIDAGAPVSVSYCGIAAHDIGTQGCSVVVQSSVNDIDWTTRSTPSYVPPDDTPLFFLFPSTSARYWRVRVASGTGNPTIGVIFIGAVTEFPQPAVYSPGYSIDRGVSTSFAANITEGGQWSGRSIIRTQISASMRVDNLSETWIASTFNPFADAARTQPFFVADRPSGYPASCAYAWTASDLRAERERPNADNANTVTIPFSGFDS